MKNVLKRQNEVAMENITLDNIITVSSNHFKLFFFVSLLLLLLLQAKRLHLTAIEEYATTMTSELETLEGQVQEYNEEQNN